MKPTTSENCQPCPPTDDECAALTVRFIPALGQDPEVGELYLKIRKFATTNGRLPEDPLVQTMCNRMKIDAHRAATGQRGDRPGAVKVSIDDFLEVDGHDRLAGTPPELVTAPTQRRIDFKALVAQLPPLDQTAMNLKAEGFTFAEIGQMMGGVSAQRIEQRIRSATSKLRELARK